ncbi:hypothetical protein [Mycolicibacterium septicum]|uniref:hypothetical protein n=1 Tax=Mycolicibacterium septicum TaxID=98668 RepID=UPI001AF6E114|nr:hypothetical protein [Mycolicibacterium septicum]QRY49068.1 hypothetical protein JVX95_15700 [Mycolicibacterium septicum]
MSKQPLVERSQLREVHPRMTSAAAPGEPSRRSQWLEAAAHWLPFLLGAAVVARVAIWFGVLVNVGYIVLVVFLVGSVVTMLHHHSGQLCIRCMNDVPADAPTRAQRQKAILRFSHFTMTVPAILVLLVLTFGAILIAHLIPEGSQWPYIPQSLWVLMLAYAELVHHRLRPWCPYCRDWDDEGDHEPSPDPTTFGTKSMH